jgi:uncharacterized protein YlxP (DUF503 family)
LIGLLSIHLHLPGCASLKEKRGRIKSLLARLHKEFNVSAAEMNLQDKWQETIIACGMVSNDFAYLKSALETVSKWVEAHWSDGDIVDRKIEII